eukprot:scaffold109954_cov28-Tisochrysis_lutea.AAC.4
MASRSSRGSTPHSSMAEATRPDGGHEPGPPSELLWSISAHSTSLSTDEIEESSDMPAGSVGTHLAVRAPPRRALRAAKARTWQAASKPSGAPRHPPGGRERACSARPGTRPPGVRAAKAPPPRPEAAAAQREQRRPLLHSLPRPPPAPTAHSVPLPRVRSLAPPVQAPLRGLLLSPAPPPSDRPPRLHQCCPPPPPSEQFLHTFCSIRLLSPPALSARVAGGERDVWQQRAHRQPERGCGGEEREKRERAEGGTEGAKSKLRQRLEHGAQGGGEGSGEGGRERGGRESSAGDGGAARSVVDNKRDF